MIHFSDDQKHDWLRNIYSETWTQYRHEDELGIKRSTFYLAAEGGVVAIATLIGSPLLKEFWDLLIAGSLLSKPVVGVSVFGLVAGVSAVLVFLSFLWKSATEAGQAYVNMRWYTLFEIERQLRDLGIGLNALPAQFENAYRNHCRATDNNVSYFPYREGGKVDGAESVPGLKSKWLMAMPRSRGWALLKRSSTMLIYVHASIGIGSLLAGVWIWLQK